MMAFVSVSRRNGLIVLNFRCFASTKEDVSLKKTTVLQGSETVKTGKKMSGIGEIFISLQAKQTL